MFYPIKAAEKPEPEETALPAIPKQLNQEAEAVEHLPVSNTEQAAACRETNQDPLLSFSGGLSQNGSGCCMQKTGCLTYADLIHLRDTPIVSHPGTALKAVPQTGTAYRRAVMLHTHRYMPRDLPG